MHAMLNLRLGYTSAEHGRKRLPLVVDPILGDAAPPLSYSRDSSHLLPRTDRSADKLLRRLTGLDSGMSAMHLHSSTQHSPTNRTDMKSAVFDDSAYSV